MILKMIRVNLKKKNYWYTGNYRIVLVAKQECSGGMNRQNIDLSVCLNNSDVL